MSILNITITNAGRAAMVAGNHTALNPLALTHFAVGTANYTPSAGQTALVAPLKQLTSFGGEHVGDGIIHVAMQDISGDAYALREFGLYTNTGVLFAVFALPSGTILEKNQHGVVLLTVDIAFTDIDATALALPVPQFSNPPATLETAGVAKIATPQMMIEGINNECIATPKTINALLSLFGLSSTGSDDYQGFDRNRFFSVHANTPSTPWGGIGASGIHVQEGVGYGWQIGCNDSGSLARPKVRTTTSIGVWGPWFDLITSLNAASESSAGVVELASPVETLTGTDGSRATTPQGVKAVRDLIESWALANFATNIAATTSAAGPVELATPPETTTGTDGSRAATPQGVKAVRDLIETWVLANFATNTAATTSAAGPVELATLPETVTGTDGSRATTPQGVKAVRDLIESWVLANFATNITATTSAAGPVELATPPETVTGTDGSRAATPQGIKAVRDLIEAWVLANFATNIAATTSAAGPVELATSAEVITGTDGARAATSAAIRALLDTMGLGARGTTNLNGFECNRFFTIEANQVSNPWGGIGASGVHIQEGIGYGWQLACNDSGTVPVPRIRTTSGLATFGEWLRLITEKSFATSVYAGISRFATIAEGLSGVANDIGMTPASTGAVLAAGIGNVVGADITLSITGAGFSQANAVVKKIGNLVFLTARFALASATAGTTLAIVPAGMRPAAIIRDGAWLTNSTGQWSATPPHVRMEIGTGGAIVIDTGNDFWGGPVQFNIFWRV